MRNTMVIAATTLVLVCGCASGLHRPVSSMDAVTDTQGVQRVQLDLHTYYFKPNRIVVHAGHPVEIVLHNRALIVPHNFSVSDSALKVSVDKWGTGTAVARFTPKVAGEYRFYCDEHGHAGHGMTGTLVVLP
jgi:plastocyanin